MILVATDERLSQGKEEPVLQAEDWGLGGLPSAQATTVGGVR